MGHPVSSESAFTPEALGAVPLFPLPNVVLFPRAVLPLHIFEQRYKAMTADALSGQRQIAMALLRAGWEKTYHGRPDIEPVVCVGTILTHEQLPDGEYNFLLQGHTRAKIVRELSFGTEDYKPYRIAELEPLRETPMDEANLISARQRLLELFTSDVFHRTGLAQQFRQMLKSTTMPTGEVADLLAFSYLDDVPAKQQLLAEPDVAARVVRTLAELEALRPRIRPLIQRSESPNLN
jgi:Lon protease-like protein